MNRICADLQGESDCCGPRRPWERAEGKSKMLDKTTWAYNTLGGTQPSGRPSRTREARRSLALERPAGFRRLAASPACGLLAAHAAPCISHYLLLGTKILHHPGESGMDFPPKLVHFGRFGPRDFILRIPIEISRYLMSPMSKVDGEVPKLVFFGCPVRHS